ncbi:MAG: hypothetical protein RR657_06840, partial [Peptostreptococcaceae bacterium]
MMTSKSRVKEGCIVEEDELEINDEICATYEEDECDETYEDEYEDDETYDDEYEEDEDDEDDETYEEFLMRSRLPDTEQNYQKFIAGYF